MAVTESLLARDYIRAEAEKRFEVTTAGSEWFAGSGLHVRALPPSRCGTARRCLDWTERRHHLAGPLGVRLLSAMCEAGWLRREAGSRAVEVTAPGQLALRSELGVDTAALRA